MHAACRRVQAQGCRLEAASCTLQARSGWAASCMLQAGGSRREAAGWRLRAHAAGARDTGLQAGGCELQAGVIRRGVAGWRLRVPASQPASLRIELDECTIFHTEQLSWHLSPDRARPPPNAGIAPDESSVKTRAAIRGRPLYSWAIALRDFIQALCALRKRRNGIK